MKLKKKDKRVRNSIFSFKYFLIMLASVFFCNGHAILIFMKHMDFEHDMIFLRENLFDALLNALGLSLLFTIVFSLYKMFQFQKPTERILRTVAKIGKGNFSARVPTSGKKKKFKNEYDIIIEEINKMAEDLGGVETMRTDFISNVSHEMKTPLTVIQNYSTILQDNTISAEERDTAVKTIHQTAKSMSHMITNMLKLNKLENQQIFPQRTRYELSEQLRESIIHFEHIWEEKDITILADIPDEVYVTADKELTMLIWLNLLSNAFKFTPEKGTVSVNLVEQNHCAYVTVIDTGCGMTQEEQKHIFEKFYQCDNSHSVQGNGLGLALVKRICDIFHYRIDVESTPGKGSAFSVTVK